MYSVKWDVVVRPELIDVDMYARVSTCSQQLSNIYLDVQY